MADRSSITTVLSTERRADNLKIRCMAWLNRKTRLVTKLGVREPTSKVQQIQDASATFRQKTVPIVSIVRHDTWPLRKPELETGQRVYGTATE